MNLNQINRLMLAGIVSAACLFSAKSLAQQTTAFTYQGQLRDGGTNANGTYTMIFKLYDAAISGIQISSAITNSPTLGNGLFSVNLDFGAGAFNGNARWLDITITNGGATQTLSPRVQVLPAPYALYAAVAATVTNGAIMNAQLATNAVTSTSIAGGQVVKSLNGLRDVVVISAGANVALFTNGNSLQVSAGVPTNQVFLTSGTFTVPANVTRLTVEAWGGGGGGGTNNATIKSIGSGGGGGGYGRMSFDVTPGANINVVVGLGGAANSQGGTTSFGGFISVTGGSPGVTGGSIDAEPVGGAGGSSTALINITGGTGNWGGRDLAGNGRNGGDGGGAGCGGGGGKGSYNSTGGEAGQAPGGGGGGCGVDTGTPVFRAGGSGGNGRVIVYY